MKKLLLFALLLLASLPAYALCWVDHIEPVPQRPTAGQDLYVRIDGYCSYQFIDSRVVVEGNVITIHGTHSEGGPASVGRWAERVKIGRVPAGTYDVLVTGNGEPAGRSIVTVADDARVLPRFGTSGSEVVILGAATGLCEDACAPVVRFGGVASPRVRVAGADLVAEVPEQVATVVDVTLLQGAKTLTFSRAFRYGSGEPRDYERLLFPLRYDGRGAGTSQWMTRNVVRNDGPLTIRTSLLQLASGERAALANAATDGGLFLHVPRGLSRYLSASSHAADLSRSDDNLGTEMKVLTETEARRTITFGSVPFTDGYRLRLRAYGFHPGDEPLHLRIQAAGTSVAVPLPLHGSDPSFGAVDLEGLVPHGRSYTVSIEGEPWQQVWAFITVTNRVTQQVTTITPR